MDVQQTRAEYDASGNPIYVGKAPIGYEDTEGINNLTGWTIKKITWTSDNPTLIQIAYGKWNDRASLIYK